MKQKKNQLKWALITLLIMVLTVVAMLSQSKDLTLSDLGAAIQSANKGYLFLILVCMVMYILSEGLALKHLLAASNHYQSLGNSVIYAASDIYCSAITPSATGGQPVCAYFMKRDGVPMGYITAVLTMYLVLHTFSTLTIGASGIILGGDLFVDASILSKILIVLGYISVSGLAVLFVLLLGWQKTINKAGGKIIDWRTKEEIYSQHLPSDVISVLYNYAKEHGYALLGYVGKEIITESADDKYVAEESRINKMPIRKVENLLAELEPNPTKLLMTAEPTVAAEAEKELQELVGNRMDVYRSAPFFVELVPKGIDKAQSLLRLLAKLNLTPQDMIAFGDGYNDLSMLHLAGMGVAMSNAAPEVRSEADYVTLSNEEDGVAVAINKLCYNNE